MLYWYERHLFALIYLTGKAKCKLSKSSPTGKDARNGELDYNVAEERVEEIWTFIRKENCQIFILLRGRQKEYISHFSVVMLLCNVWFFSVVVHWSLHVETYGKDEIQWKWQTTFIKIYMLVVLWLYFCKIMTRILFSDSFTGKGHVVKGPNICH